MGKKGAPKKWRDEPKEKLGTCQWFIMCLNPATGVEPHPILGEVPICTRCKKKIDSIQPGVK